MAKRVLKPVVSWLAMFTCVSMLVACQTSSPNKLSKDPQKAVESRTKLAAQHIRNGDLDSAKKALDQALKTDSRSVEAHIMMGVLLQAEGSQPNLEQAEYHYKRAIALDSKNPRARNNYGGYLYQRQRYNDAIEQLNIAGSTLGYDQRGLALQNLGRTYLKLNDLENAERYLKQAIQVDRTAYLAMIELAELFYLSQRHKEARQAYEMFVRTVGQKNQDAAALWTGLRIARANDDQIGMQVLVNQLRGLYPNSVEYKRYLKLQYTTEAVWK